MSKPLALNEIRRRAAQFAVEWRDAEGYERGDAQSFVRDLLGVYGITATRAALYEKRAIRSSSGQRGFIDALVPGLLVIEMKSAGRDLNAAEGQALDYLDSLSDAEMPRWVLTSDFKRFRLMDVEAGWSGESAVEWSLADFARNADRLGFLAGYGVRAYGPTEQEAASVKAARLMAGLYEMLEGTGYDDHEASVFLVRTLFCLYADDAGVWERDLFTEFLATRTAEDGSDLGAQLSVLYQVLGSARRQSTIDELLGRFPYVNGGVFDGPIPIPMFDSLMRKRLLAACDFNWSAISPAVFGSLFQAVKSKQARRELGEHYTTETNIMRLIGPMFLDELHARVEKSRSDVRKLERLRRDMGQMRFLDPACGCGNFLVVAYREMRALDLAILERLQELSPAKYPRSMVFTADVLPVKLSSFHGIEIDEWPARIAATALHLVEHNANQAMELALGSGPDTLPLDKVHTITVGNALRLDWADIVPPTEHLHILGNPPFVGMAWMSTEQQEDNRIAFTNVESGGLRTGRLDYVACWYAKAIAFARSAPGTRVAFVSTNSLTQGEQARTMVPLLTRHAMTVDFAHQTFRWSSEAPGAAAVHCVIVGFSSSARRGRAPRLFTYPNIAADPVERPVSRLNFYLVDGPDIVPVKLTAPAVAGMPFATQGNKPVDGGFLLVTEGELPALLADPLAAPYLRRFVQGQDMLQGGPIRWCLWLKDATPSDLKGSALLRGRLAGVRHARELSPTESVREFANKPAVFTQDRQPDSDYFALPEVSSGTRRWIPGRFYRPDVIAGNKLIIFPRAELWQAALIQSSMFMAWVVAFAGRLKSDISLSPALTYFPIPWPTLDDKEQQGLAAALQGVLDVRDQFPGGTLADLYAPDAMPPALLDAHNRLDDVVDRAFGAKRRLADNSERLRLLLDAYQAMTTADQLPLAPKKSRSRRQPAER